MANETGVKEFIGAAAKGGAELMNDKEFVKQMTDPKVLAEANAAIKAAMADPEARKMGAKFTVDAMQQAGVDFAKAGENLPKFGVPTTREEFDKAYKDATSMVGGDILKASVSTGAALASNKALQDNAVDLTAASIKTTTPDVIDELKGRGVDPSGYIKATSKIALAPADIDVTKLDPRLTADERTMVVASQAMSAKLADGRLQSTPEDAPATSKWANRIKAERAAAPGKETGIG